MIPTVGGMKIITLRDSFLNKLKDTMQYLDSWRSEMEIISSQDSFLKKLKGSMQYKSILKRPWTRWGFFVGTRELEAGARHSAH